MEPQDAEVAVSDLDFMPMGAAELDELVEGLSCPVEEGAGEGEAGPSRVSTGNRSEHRSIEAMLASMHLGGGMTSGEVRINMGREMGRVRNRVLRHVRADEATLMSVNDRMPKHW